MKSVRLLFVSLLLCFASALHAQQYNAFSLNISETSNYDTFDQFEDTLRLHFNNIPSGMYGNAKFVVFFEGNYTDMSEQIEIFDENLQQLAVAGPNRTFQDCSLDSMEFYLTAAQLAAYGSTFQLILVPTAQVDWYCPNNRATVRLEVNYCTYGLPAEHASILNNNQFLCQGDVVTLQGVPAGGTFSGAGVSGNTLNTTGQTVANYVVRYIAVDSIGCETRTTWNYRIKPTPEIQGAAVACANTAVTLSTSGVTDFNWYDNPSRTTPIGTGTAVTVQPAATSTYFVNAVETVTTFVIDSLKTTNYATVDHESVTGDDRGGIAVTNNYVYINGDVNVARYDLNLQNPVALPEQDGLFSDLKTGRLWTLYDADLLTPPVGAPPFYNFNAICELDSDLNTTPVILPLSENIPMGMAGGQSGIFAGYGFLVVYSGLTHHWYAISLTTGVVQDLGSISDPQFFPSENWSVWGIAEYDGTNYSVIYHENTNTTDISRRVLPDQPSTVVLSTAGIGDLASLTFSPALQRWYLHYEGANAQFLGGNETMIYADAVSTTTTLQTENGCGAQHTVVVPTLSLPADTALCGTSFTVTTATDYTAYNWNGTTGTNIFTTSSSGMLTLQVTDTNTCVLTDSMQVTLHQPASISLGNDTAVCQQDYVVSLPVGYAFYTWNGTTSTSYTYNVNATETIGVTVIDTNGCTATDTLTVTMLSLPQFDLGNDTSACALSLELTAPTGYTTYTWNGTAGSANNFVATATQQVLLVVTDGNGCSNSDSVQVTLHTPAEISLGNDTTVCQQDYVISLPMGYQFYTWNGVTSTSYTYQTNQHETVGVTVTDFNGCQASDTVTVSMHPLPQFSLGNDSTACATVITVTGPAGYANYTWNGTGGGNNTYDASTSGLVTLQVTDNNGCSGSDSLLITLHTPVSLSLGNDTLVCGNSFEVDATAGFTDYTWNGVAGSNIYTTTTSGAIILNIGDANGCTATDTINVQLSPVPDASFSAPALLCVYAAPLALTPVDTTGHFTGNGVDSGGVFTPATAGIGTATITYSITTGTGCTASVSQDILVDACTGIDEATPVTFTAFPNPAKESLHILLNEGITSADIRMYDTTGKLVSSQTSRGTSTIVIPVSSLNAGMYCLIVKTEKGSSVQHVLIDGL